MCACPASRLELIIVRTLIITQRSNAHAPGDRPERCSIFAPRRSGWLGLLCWSTARRAGQPRRDQSLHPGGGAAWRDALRRLHRRSAATYAPNVRGGGNRLVRRSSRTASSSRPKLALTPHGSLQSVTTYRQWPRAVVSDSQSRDRLRSGCSAATEPRAGLGVRLAGSCIGSCRRVGRRGGCRLSL